MQFNVPKFIDIEDKIFGPLTFKQFVYLIGGAGLCLVLLWLIPIRIVAIFLGLIVVAFSLALAFYQVNNKPFIYIVQAAFNFATNPRIYIWKHREHKDKSKDQLNKELRQIESTMRDADSDRLGQKSMSVTVGQDKNAPAEDDTPPTPNR